MRSKLTAIASLFFLTLLLSAAFSSLVNAALPGGKFGDALEFDGVDDYVIVPDSPSLRIPSTEVTVEAWIYFPSNTSGIQYVMRKWIDSDGGWLSYTLARNEAGGISGSLGNQALQQFPVWGATQNITELGIEDTWAHVAFTWKKQNITSEDGRIFVNGLSVNTTFYPNGYSAAFTIGYGNYPLYLARRVDSTWSNNYFQGRIDEMRISNVSRTTFNLASAPSVDGDTIALWHFDEGTGFTAQDSSANANNGTISGTTWTGVIPELSSIVLVMVVVGLSLVTIVVRKWIPKTRQKTSLIGKQAG